MHSIVLATVVFLTVLSGGLYGRDATIAYDPANPTISFAADNLKEALAANNFLVHEVTLTQLEGAASPFRIIVAIQGHPVVQNFMSRSGITRIGFRCAQCV